MFCDSAEHSESFMSLTGNPSTDPSASAPTLVQVNISSLNSLLTGDPASTMLPTSHLPCVHAKSLQSCPTLCDLVDCSPPSSCVHGILQARILEWVAISSSRGSSWPRDWTQVSYVSCIGRWVLYRWAAEEALICKQAPALSPFSTTTARPFYFTILCPSKYVKNPRDGVAQSWTRLKWLSSSKYVSMCTTGVCAFFIVQSPHPSSPSCARDM